MCSCSGFLVQDPDQFGLEAKAQKKTRSFIRGVVEKSNRGLVKEDYEGTPKHQLSLAA
jgi:hypothetical protein